LNLDHAIMITRSP